VAVGMITDQSPNPNEAHYWTTFLNQDTVFMDGAERIAKLMDFPVFYCELQKQGRGYCRISFECEIMDYTTMELASHADMKDREMKISNGDLPEKTEDEEPLYHL
jgi:lauroyl/myristoyl acyltransferase